MHQRIPNSAAARLAVLAVIATVCVAGSAGAAVGAGQPRVELSSSSDDLVISVREQLGEMESTDYPTLRVYADGTVERHLPEYMKNAGDHAGRISREELLGLVESLAGQGIIEFDAQAVHESRAQAEQARSTVFVATDPSIIRIQIRLAGYQAPGSLVMERDVEKSLSYVGLRGDARRHPEIGAIQNLNASFTELNALADRIVAGSAGAAAKREAR